MVRSFMGARRLLDICQRYCNRDLWSLHIICALRENQCIEIHLLLCKNMSSLLKTPLKNTNENYDWEIHLKIQFQLYCTHPGDTWCKFRSLPTDFCLSLNLHFLLKLSPPQSDSQLLYLQQLFAHFCRRRKGFFLYQSSSPPTVSSKVWFKAQLEHNFHTVSFYLCLYFIFVSVLVPTFVFMCQRPATTPTVIRGSIDRSGNSSSVCL